jgi:hypothetical protein
MKATVSAVSTALLLLCAISYFDTARAQEEVRVKPVDVYISGFGGYSVPFKTDISSGPLTAPNVDLDNSPSFGGKIGMWFTAPRKTLGIDMGAEIDVTHFNPNISRTPIEMNATYFGINVLARLPIGVTPELPNGRWFPYLGLGGGGHRLSMEVLGEKAWSTSPAFQGLGGVKVFVTRHFAAFAEGKFIHASNSIKDQSGASLDLTLNSVHGVAGLSFHF